MSHKITKISMEEGSLATHHPEVAHELRVAIADLLHDHYFIPEGIRPGSYEVLLRKEEQRLIFEIHAGDETCTVHIPTQPLRSIIRDYFMICESYYEAIRSHDTRKVEAVDMGRRGMHNEAAERVQEMLKGKIDVNFSTARRLFTLIAVLHMKGA